MKVESRDILTVESGIIAHQVNLKGVMGAGLALQIRRKYPQVYDSYRRHFRSMELGSVQMVGIDDELTICNIAAQLGYGTSVNQTNYQALRVGLIKLKEYADRYHRQVYLPYGIGCGLAGGDWDIVSVLIAECVPDAIVCRLQNTERRLHE